MLAVTGAGLAAFSGVAAAAAGEDAAGLAFAEIAPDFFLAVGFGMAVLAGGLDVVIHFNHESTRMNTNRQSQKVGFW
ncbi:MAG TPA: hypothetical protein DCE44_01105 [Verrucomicrobiales bacterium]|nr:hypothetical protein [Verrucomicrobiales bacterium]